jgi:hypothetical protein
MDRDQSCDYGLDGCGTGVRFPEGATNLLLLHSVQTGSGAHPMFYVQEMWILRQCQLWLGTVRLCRVGGVNEGGSGCSISGFTWRRGNYS